MKQRNKTKEITMRVECVRCGAAHTCLQLHIPPTFDNLLGIISILCLKLKQFLYSNSEGIHLFFDHRHSISLFSLFCPVFLVPNRLDSLCFHLNFIISKILLNSIFRCVLLCIALLMLFPISKFPYIAVVAISIRQFAM